MNSKTQHLGSHNKQTLMHVELDFHKGLFTCSSHSFTQQRENEE